MTEPVGTALVTGAARRIGLRIAERLAQAGYDVVLHASDRSRAEATREAARIAGLGRRTAVVTGDLSDVATCQRLIVEAGTALGPLTLLVNNAALFEDDRPDRFDEQAWTGHMAVNLRAPVLLSQHFAAQAPTDRDCAVINLIDQRVLRPTPLYFSYTLAKAALWTATQTMAQAFADRGVRVNAIGPGPVLPNTRDGVDGFSKEIEGVPLHRPVAVDDIAATVLYLASASTVTGQIIAVDSGQHLGWRTPDVID